MLVNYRWILQRTTLFATAVMLMMASLWYMRIACVHDDASADSSMHHTRKRDGPFPFMNKAETQKLQMEDTITCIPDREELNSRNLDYVYVYDTWIRYPNDTAYASKAVRKYYYHYRETGEHVIMNTQGKIRYRMRVRFSHMIIKPVRYVYDSQQQRWDRRVMITPDSYISARNINGR